MIDFVCDRCKCQIDPRFQRRYVVHLEVTECYPDPADSLADHFDKDLDQLSELNLQLLDPSKPESEHCGDGGRERRQHRYDLCEACHTLWARNPIGRDTLAVLDAHPN